MFRNAYSTDLSDAQWQALRPFLPNLRSEPTFSKRKGRPRKHDLREILNAVRYQNRYGCSWRDLPSDLPPWETVYAHLRRWRMDGTIKHLHEALLQSKYDSVP